MSRLFEKMMVGCIMMDKTSVPDGLGGFTRQWVDGATFEAAIVKDNSLAARVAEKEGVSEVYTITMPKSINLEFHDVFRRISDGAIFRVTSNVTDSRTPNAATFQFGQVTAERWELPSD